MTCFLNQITIDRKLISERIEIEMIGIIGAMDIEVQGLKDRMKNLVTETVGSIEFSTGILHGVECVVARCGIGKVNAAMCAQTMILRYSPSAIINTGVAGGIGRGISIGHIVVAKNVVQHDMDTTAVGDPKGFLSGPDLVAIPCSERLIKEILRAAEDSDGPACHIGTIATGDQFIHEQGALEKIRETFGASACEMEGGSIGQVCYLNQVPFAVIRAISDNADDESHIDYREFVGPAAQDSIQLLCRLLERLNS